MRPILIVVALVLGAAPAPAAAVDINVIGLTAGKAVVVIGKAKPRTLTVGETSPEGVKLIASSSEAATFEVAGKRQTLTTGQHGVIEAGPSGGGAPSVVSLTADSRGHFIANGSVNGISVRFLVDTGASTVALSVDEAKRAGVNYLAGSRGRVQTANGSALVYNVKLDAVRIGDITLNNVDAAIVDSDKLGIALLGMSFLNRMEMKRAGDTLTLIKRY
jgi:aspartyl protease family protein